MASYDRASIVRKWVCSVAFIFFAAAPVAGCKSGTPTSDGPAAPASSNKAGSANYVSSAPLSNQLTTVPITDPTLNNMVALQLTVPTGWNLQGIEMISPCSPGPSPVFRAYSPDGLMQFRMEPIIGWKWATNGHAATTGCANITRAISAADFLQYYVGTIPGGVHIIGPMPVTAQFAQWAEGFAASGNQNNNQGPVFMRATNIPDNAALRVEVVNGSFVVEERLRVATVCAINSNPGPTNGGSCFARVDVLSAPVGRLDALAQLVDSKSLPNPVPNDQYRQALLQQLSEKNAKENAERLAEGRAESAEFSRFMYNTFQQNMARSATEHQQFMQQQESQFETSMNNAINQMNARSTAASDWVDYALDQQTVANPDGTLTKVSSAYSQTWTNGTQWYQTNDPNANPNGVLSGNWSPATPTHGNGTPQ